MIVNAILLSGNSFMETIKKFSIENVGEDQVILFLIGFGVVFLSLTLIFLLISTLGKFINLDLKKKKQENKEEVKNETKVTTTIPSAENEINVAIAMALGLYFNDQHDEESLILTMDIRERMSSQWNNKIQLIN